MTNPKQKHLTLIHSYEEEIEYHQDNLRFYVLRGNIEESAKYQRIIRERERHLARLKEKSK